jgi:hypothetical protein
MNYNKVNFDDDNLYFYNNKEVVVIVGTNNINGVILNSDDTHVKIKLNKPAYISNDSIIIICDKLSETFHIGAYGYLELKDYSFEELEPPIEFKSQISINDEESESDIDIDDI